jgi:hypothetical protein
MNVEGTSNVAVKKGADEPKISHFILKKNKFTFSPS